MSLNLALALALIITCALGFGVCAFAKWHHKRFLRIPYSQINEHRITPSFTVGSDAK
jgi:uncharacterized metal-binding protein